MAVAQRTKAYLVFWTCAGRRADSTAAHARDGSSQLKGNGE